ncbi:MAG: S-adenosylmethionine:tRNA ribosyltransferase-isomerase [Nocardioides sp.]
MSVASATLTPEARGLARDEVRLAVVRPGGTDHTHVRELPGWLEPGDLLVVNTSATLPAAVDTAYGAVHVSTELDDGAWVVELRRSDGRGHRTPEPCEVVTLPGGVRLRVDRPHPAGQTRLWRATTLPRVRRGDYLTEHGRPIRYPYLERAVPLEDLQNVYADRPGSAEMPSAGRPLTRELLVRLMASGVVVAPLVLHTGVASQESHEPPQPEWFSVPAHTARLVKLTKQTGGRVLAVGTTVVRALEAAAGGISEGWTDLVLGPERPARVVDGLLTGLHEPEASHLRLLEAVAGRDLVDRAYADLTTEGAPSYLWHELGDSMLFLPC